MTDKPVGGEMNIVSYGGGKNGAGMLVGMVERGEIPPDHILMADTKAELPETYEHIRIMNDWLIHEGFPAIRLINRSGESLEEECLRRKALPSIAYGFRSCSDKFKKRVIRKHLRYLGINEATMLIGFHAGEAHRERESDVKWIINRFPLIEWGWDNEDCIAAISREGLPIPPKSSCFFCPARRKAEILELKQHQPELYARAIALESNAELTTLKGLGRRFAWRDITEVNEDTPVEVPCECVE